MSVEPPPNDKAVPLHGRRVQEGGETSGGGRGSRIESGGVLRRRIRMPQIYRGWWVVTAPFLVATVATGAGQYGFGMFYEPLEEAFGWSRSQISLSLSFTMVGGLIAPVLGRVIDRYGTKVVMVASLVLVTLSFLLRPAMTELWHWYALSLLQYIGYTGASMLATGKLVGVWFQRTRGRAMGITAMGNNFGGLVIPPMMGGMLTLFAWQGTYVGVGIMTGLLVIYTLVTVRDFPTREEVSAEFEQAGDSSAALITGWTVSEALRVKAFYAITLSILLGTFTYSAILPNIIPHLTNNGQTLTIAIYVQSVFAIFGMVGKFAMGLLSEKITSRYALMINFIGHSLFLAIMTLFVDPRVIWIAVPLFGIFHGAFGALFQLVVQDAFGVRNFGSIMGVINLPTMVSFGVGPVLAGMAYDMTESYAPAFLAISVMFAIGALALTQAGTSGSPANVRRETNRRVDT